MLHTISLNISKVDETSNCRFCRSRSGVEVVVVVGLSSGHCPVHILVRLTSWNTCPINTGLEILPSTTQARPSASPDIQTSWVTVSMKVVVRNLEYFPQHRHSLSTACNSLSRQVRASVRFVLGIPRCHVLTAALSISGGALFESRSHIPYAKNRNN